MTSSDLTLARSTSRSLWRPSFRRRSEARSVASRFPRAGPGRVDGGPLVERVDLVVGLGPAHLPEGIDGRLLQLGDESSAMTLSSVTSVPGKRRIRSTLQATWAVIIRTSTGTRVPGAPHLEDHGAALDRVDQNALPLHCRRCRLQAGETQKSEGP